MRSTNFEACNFRSPQLKWFLPSSRTICQSFHVAGVIAKQLLDGRGDLRTLSAMSALIAPPAGVLRDPRRIVVGAFNLGVRDYIWYLLIVQTSRHSLARSGFSSTLVALKLEIGSSGLPSPTTRGLCHLTRSTFGKSRTYQTRSAGKMFRSSFTIGSTLC